MAPTEPFSSVSASISSIFTIIPPRHIALLVLAYGAFLVLNRYIIQPYTSPINNLAGPRRTDDWNPWVGHLRPIIKGLPGEAAAKWIEQFGTVFRYDGIFGAPRIMVADPVAIQYILNHTEIFQKDDMTRRFLRRILGEGLLNVEGADHRRQRKVMNPAFGPQLIRDHHLPIFYDKAYQLRDVLQEKLSTSLPDVAVSDKSQGQRIEISRLLGKTTLDVIGLAGFGYEFDSLHDPENELALALELMLSAGQNPSPLHILQEILPGGQYLPSKRIATQKASLETTHRIGKALVEEKKAAVRAGEASIEKGKGKDLLSMVVRANMDPDLKESQRMSDAEVIATIQTFVLAGAETSSTALTWASWVLACRPDVQDKLREECEAVPEEQPSMNDLDGLPYLDAFVHEVLRIYSPVPQTRRDAISETVVPLGHPMKGRDGKMIESIVVPKNTPCMLAVLNVNTSKEIWGPDAAEFKPERWMNKENNPASESIPGVWGSQMTFIGGPRACIGFRFSLIEVKALLFMLIRNFAFAEAVPTESVIRKTSIVTRPFIKGEEAAGYQMPVLLRSLA